MYALVLGAVSPMILNTCTCEILEWNHVLEFLSTVSSALPEMRGHGD